MTILKPELRIKRFENMGLGMFIHWGLYSQLGMGEWAQNLRKIPMSEYIKLKDTFTAADFNGRYYAKLAKRAGMKYIVFTTRHHDGFSLYDTAGLSDFDVMNSPVGRDLVAELVEGCREEEILPIFYHTTLDWYQDSFEKDFDGYLEYLRKSVEILCTNYGEIGGLWFDGNWSKPNADWKLDELYGTIRKHQPNALIINNTGLDAKGKLSHPEIDSVTFEQGLPTPINRNGMEKYITGEMCQTMNNHWGFGKRDFDYKSTGDFIENLCACRKCGTNYLLNIGPKAEGEVLKIQEAILEIIGDWMDINGDAVREGKPCSIKGQGKDFALKTPEGKIYLFIHELKISGDVNVTLGGGMAGIRAFSGLDKKISKICWLDNGESLKFSQNTEEGVFSFEATGYNYGDNLVVRVAELNISN